MKRIISSILAAVMILTLLSCIVLPAAALNPADFGEVTLWSDKTVYEVGDPIMVQGSVEYSPVAPASGLYLHMRESTHSYVNFTKKIYIFL